MNTSPAGGCCRRCCCYPVPGPQGPQGPAGPQGPQGVQGPQGPQGVPGESAESVFSGMYTITGYPVLTTETGETTAVLFDRQSLTRGSFAFEPGSIQLEPFLITPGTLIVNEAGIYEVYYAFTNVYTTVSAQYDTAVTVNGIPILNSLAHLTMEPDGLYNMSRMTTAALQAGDRLQVTVQAFAPGQFVIGGNTNELLVHRIGNL